MVLSYNIVGRQECRDDAVRFNAIFVTGRQEFFFYYFFFLLRISVG